MALITSPSSALSLPFMSEHYFLSTVHFVLALRKQRTRLVQICRTVRGKSFPINNCFPSSLATKFLAISLVHKSRSVICNTLKLQLGLTARGRPPRHSPFCGPFCVNFSLLGFGEPRTEYKLGLPIVKCQMLMFSGRQISRERQNSRVFSGFSPITRHTFMQNVTEMLLNHFPKIQRLAFSKQIYDKTRFAPHAEG